MCLKLKFCFESYLEIDVQHIVEQVMRDDVRLVHHYPTNYI